MEYHLKYPELQQSAWLHIGTLKLKKSFVLTFVFLGLTFLAALYYVEQQVQLRKLNYAIIELKQQKIAILEQRKTLQLELDQAKRLDKIEQEMSKQGFIPAAKEQLRIVKDNPSH